MRSCEPSSSLPTEFLSSPTFIFFAQHKKKHSNFKKIVPRHIFFPFSSISDKWHEFHGDEVCHDCFHYNASFGWELKSNTYLFIWFPLKKKNKSCLARSFYSYIVNFYSVLWFLWCQICRIEFLSQSQLDFLTLFSLLFFFSWIQCFKWHWNS